VDETGDDHDFRFRAIHAALNAVKRKGSLILVDEADAILNAAAMPQVRNLTNKSWINNFLDNHDRTIIWITNRSWGIEPSTMRRFAFSLRFDKLTHKNRMSVLRYELEKNDLAGYYDEHEIKDLASRYDVDAGGIVNAVNVLKLQKRGSKGRVKETVEVVLKNHQEATIGKRHSVRPRDFLTYSLEGLNTSQDLERIITQLNNHSERKANLPNLSVSILLYGQPGTGKSEFVHYLGHCLGRDIALKRVSDIESKYVGESEQNIARAFREAQADESLLFFDEADSFFYPRKDAFQSYEKKFTNELLAQLDDYQGIVIFATNDIEGLDHAAIRRFRFKIQFLPLKPEGIMHFYRLLLSPLVTGGGNPGSNERLRLLSIQNLTPGDFAVVKDQYFFDQGAMVFHEDLISALEREVGHKKGMRVGPGFNSGMN
jgi:DNA replication protein DnaC